ncbi:MULTISPECIES: preprotein translocase subunit YajC [Acidithrix]|uniref:Preprotein translocase subunit YajC n=1 Tax=Acidithrix ferrooxidans TaxID=1280514 RepID=A0A0D8HIK3_9ACTN|nr:MULTISPECIES: preprotein translocase subunit YajC [Acidithrix]KJF16876.1 preprotein translocase subunit YajC [Acidithrix ferrooxidans]CAG4932012.1 unnamed protein product [Acidithrix sp. C25]
MFLGAAAAQTGGSSLTLLLPIVLFAGIYLLVLRPRAAKAKAAQANARVVEVGDRVMMTSGILGRVVRTTEETVVVEVAPDIELSFVRRAVSRKLEEADPLYSMDEFDYYDEDEDGDVEGDDAQDESTGSADDSTHDGQIGSEAPKNALDEDGDK